MNKQKWQSIHEKELNNLENKINEACFDEEAAPEHWGGVEKAFQEYIESMNKATEIYNEENRK